MIAWYKQVYGSSENYIYYNSVLRSVRQMKFHDAYEV